SYEGREVFCVGRARGRAFEVALGRNQDAGRARDRLDDDSGDGRGIVQRHETLKIVGKLGAILGLAAAEGVTGQVVGMAKMVDAGEKSAEPLAVVGGAADRGATEVDAMIAALAADQADFRSIALCPVIGERDLERSLDRLGSRVGEEYVIEARRGDVDKLRRALEGPRMAHLEAAGEIELADLLADRLDDLGPAMPGIDTPQTRCAIDHTAAVVSGKAGALGVDKEARRL